MNRTLHLFLLLALAMLAPTIAGAADAKQEKPKIQPGKRAVQLQGGPVRVFRATPYGAPTWMLRNPKVQEELKLTDEQKKTIQETQEKLRAEQRELSAAARGLKGQERINKFREVSKKIQQKTKEANEKIKKALNKEQAERLDQIAIQQMGLRALSMKSVIDKLKITDKQQEQIGDVQNEGRQKRTKLFQDIRNGNVERAKSREKLQEITKETEKNTLEVLSKAQQEQFDKLKGKKFDFPRPQLRAVPVLPGQAQPIKGQPRRIRIQIQPGNGQKPKIQIKGEKAL